MIRAMSGYVSKSQTAFWQEATGLVRDLRALIADRPGDENAGSLDESERRPIVEWLRCEREREILRANVESLIAQAGSLNEQWESIPWDALRRCARAALHGDIDDEAAHHVRIFLARCGRFLDDPFVKKEEEERP